MNVTELGGAWTVRAVGGPATELIAEQELAGVVPGTIHTDLLRAGLIDDPFDADNESALSWIGKSVWEYSKTFTFDPRSADRHDLVCEGLDTIATITINGAVVAHTQNQHRTYRFDLRPYLATGENRIAVRFDSAEAHALSMEGRYGARPHSYTDPYNCIRKAASNFGWDWGIRAVTAGIWRRIYIHHWSEATLQRIRVLPDLEGDCGRLRVVAQIDRCRPPRPLQLQVSVGGRCVVIDVDQRRTDVAAEVLLPDVEPWWPIGYGDQRLYEATIDLRSPDGILETTRRSVGFRRVEMQTTPDDDGTSFQLVVNRKPISVRGVNWIPDDAFVTRVSADRYHERLRDAAELNANLVRVWGGGVYEDTAFFDACDHLGLLVWQDFLFACAAYPEDEPLRSEVEAEAVDAITRLGSHPSLVIWNGNNENIWGYVDWGWRPQLGERTWGEGYYQDLLPRLVRELDGTRPYSPGSPYSFTRYAHPNDPSHGTCHIWDVWNTRDYTHYADYVPRFVSEFGFQGPPAWRTLTRVVHDSPLDAYGPQMLVHQKANDGNTKLERGYTPHFPPPRDIREWHWVTQLNQAHALAFGINHFRALGRINTGMIVWQLNDDWPCISWSLVDYDGHRKPAWYAVRTCYQPRTAIFRRVGAAYRLAVINDTEGSFNEQLHLRCVDATGTVTASSTIPVNLPARSRTELDLAELCQPGGLSGALICDAPGMDRAVAHLAEVHEQGLLPNACTAQWSPTPDGVTVVVEATAFVRDLWLAADIFRVGATVDTGLITLLPGERHSFRVDGVAPEDLTDAALAEALWSANRLFATRES